MNNQLVITAYLIYLPLAILMTTFVSRKLFQSGKVFMLDIFNQNEQYAFSTNRLFELGFYLINVGFALRILYIYDVSTQKALIEVLAAKIGGFSIYLGVMMFANLYLFFRGKRVANEKRLYRLQMEQAYAKGKQE